VCPPPGVKGNGVAVNVGTVDATVLDPSDMPVPSLLAQVCGINICINGKTGANGHVIVNVNGQSLTQPAFKYGEGYTFARFAQPLPTMTPIVIPVAVTVALPAAGVDFAAGKDSVSGGVTLSIPVGGTFEVDTLTYDMPDQQLFRAAEIPIAKAPAAVDPALNLEILYGVGPVETTFCPPAAVTVPNTPAWPAGTAVEFYVHGVDVSEDYAPYGGWAKVSDGAVSADGKTVSTAAAGGLPVLSAFGVRKKP
jgi:hypothetical protein